MNRNKNIEDSYNKKFAPGEVRNEGWNDPSDKIWSAVEKELYKEDKKKFGFLPFLLMTLLAMSTITILYLYSQNNELKDSLNDAIVEQNELEKLVNEELNTTPTLAMQQNLEVGESNDSDKLEYIKQVTVEPKGVEHSDNKVTNTAKNKDVVKNNNSKSKTASAFVESDKPQYGKEDFSVNRTDQENLGSKIDDQKKLVVSIEENVSDVSKRIDAPVGIEGIETKKIKALGINDLNEIVLGPISPTALEEDKSRAAYFSVLPFVAVGILQRNGTQETALTELIDDEYGDVGFGIDFLVTQPISGAFDFVMGLGVESFNFATEYDITLPYNTDDETIQGNEGYIDFEHSLPTAFGNTDTALRLSRKRASSPLHESNVVLDFDTRHSFTALSLPIGLKYYLGLGKSRFNFGVMVRPAYIISANSGIQSVMSHHSDIDAINNVSQSTYSEIRKFNASVGLDVGYYLPLSQRGGINLNVGYQNFLMNFYEVKEYSTSVQRLNLSLGYFHAL